MKYIDKVMFKDSDNEIYHWGYKIEVSESELELLLIMARNAISTTKYLKDEYLKLDSKLRLIKNLSFKGLTNIELIEYDNNNQRGK